MLAPFGLALAQDKPPFNDVRVRRAISMAIDRQKQVDTVFEGHGILGWGVPYIYYQDKMPTAAQLGPWWQYRPAEAKKLLAEAGHPNGFETTLFYYEYFPQMTSQVQLVQQDLKKNLNINLKITKLDYTTYYGRYVDGKWDGMSWGFQSGHAVGVDERTYQYMHSKSTKNFFRVNDPVIDELVTKLRQTPDNAEQRVITKKIVDRELDQVLADVDALRQRLPDLPAARAEHRRPGAATHRRLRRVDDRPGLAGEVARRSGCEAAKKRGPMYKYVIRRLLLAVPVLLLSSLIVFGLMRVMPGDALTALMAESGNVGEKELAKLRKDLGLDRPYYEQYLIWLWSMVSLNPGYSIFTNEPIAVALKKSIPVTFELATLAMFLGLLIAVPIGVLSAIRQDTPADYTGRVVAVSGLSLPDFWLGTLVITFAALWFRWIPPLGYVSFWESPTKNLQQFLLPAAVLGFRLCRGHDADDPLDRPRSAARGLRQDRLGQGPGRAHRRLQARAQERAHPGRHHRRRAARERSWPGTVVVETIFALPGMGRLTVEAILFRDYPVVQTNVMLVAALLVTLNLLVDMTYAWLDPRIRYR